MYIYIYIYTYIYIYIYGPRGSPIRKGPAPPTPQVLAKPKELRCDAHMK